MSYNLIPAANISSSALSAERARMDITANNLANVHSTSGDNGGAYRRRVAVFESVFKDTLGGSAINDLGGVKLEEISVEDRPPIKMYAPYHPNADKEGMVEMPNISPIEEMVDMITATRAYEANLSVMNQSKDMAEKTINMFR